MYQKREVAQRGVVPCVLPQLIARNAALDAGNLLVLMYERGQVQMDPNGTIGVGAWLKENIDQYGMPSIIRFGRKDRAMVFRRDEFEAWFAPLVTKREA